MLLVPQGSRFTWKHRTEDLASSTPGISVVPGVSDADGLWTELASGAQLTQDVFAIKVWVTGGATIAQAKNHLLSIGVDPAGGTTYVSRLTQLVCGSSIGLTSTPGVIGRFFYFPVHIKAGSSVAALIRGNNATAGTVRISVTFYGRPTRPEAMLLSQFSETIGTITGSLGVSFTPGNGANGAWALLGATTKPLKWWQLGIGNNSSGTVFRTGRFDLAFGTATVKHLIIEGHDGIITANEELTTSLSLDGYAEVPDGTNLYVRGNLNGANTGAWHANAIGCG